MVEADDWPSVWATITRLEQFPQMDMADFEFLKQELKPKVTCHGYTYLHPIVINLY